MLHDPWGQGPLPRKLHLCHTRSSNATFVWVSANIIWRLGSFKSLVLELSAKPPEVHYPNNTPHLPGSRCLSTTGNVLRPRVKYNKGVETKRNGHVWKQALGSCHDSNHGQKSPVVANSRTRLKQLSTHKPLGHYCGILGSLCKNKTKSNKICFIRYGKGLSSNTIHSVNQCFFKVNCASNFGLNMWTYGIILQVMHVKSS